MYLVQRKTQRKCKWCKKCWRQRFFKWKFHLSSDRSRSLLGIKSSERYQSERKKLYFQPVWLFSDFWNFVFVIFSRNKSTPTRKPDFHHLAIQRCGRENVEKHNNSPIIIAMMIIHRGSVTVVGKKSTGLNFQVHPTDPPISPPVHHDPCISTRDFGSYRRHRPMSHASFPRLLKACPWPGHIGLDFFCRLGKEICIRCPPKSQARNFEVFLR